ncbi:hypothetical protein [Acidisphaera sp. S103]|uniref:hypothetical protein n=1 Tax=Acidisphaera sp. S103 TaxID=1747223 RepID=UPI00131A9288|nr:hypothetical protein [Acidisphaera sp. S103]
MSIGKMDERKRGRHAVQTTQMIDVSIGAVGAAVIAGLVSVLGLIIAKEQKISEFRQAWIDELRKCLVSYLVNINAISDGVRMKKAGAVTDQSVMISSYKALNEASHGIKLRINADEKPAKNLIKTMLEFEMIAEENSDLMPDKIREIEVRFLKCAKKLLKFEWERVKRGEKTFIWTKWIVIGVTIVMVAYFVYLAFHYVGSVEVEAKRSYISLSHPI